MKFAIPVVGGQISMHFGQSKEFVIIETNSSKQIVSKETISTIEHNCGSLPELLASHGVKVLLAGGMGMSPRMACERSGIEVVLGVTEPDPERAVVKYLYHRLESGENVCEHGDTVCDHGGHHEEHHGGCH
jgi:predicted Fe-Mo cluster-binding NifX family protein